MLRVICWELMAYMLSCHEVFATFNFHIWHWNFGRWIEKFQLECIWEVYESRVKTCLYAIHHILLVEFGVFFMGLYGLKLSMGFQRWFAHLPSLASQSSSLTFPTPCQTRISDLAQIVVHMGDNPSENPWQPNTIKNHFGWSLEETRLHPLGGFLKSQWELN